ncbi:MAG: hypothetical protein GXP32_00515 [Kiritimatiellaeota bacterium]|nr:hypothetical protein [Kiritimatiellota bacterium]
MTNFVDSEEYRDIRGELESLLQRKLEKVGDEFLSSDECIKKWGYDVDETGTVGYTL